MALVRRDGPAVATPGDEALEPLVASPRPPVQAEAPKPYLEGRPRAAPTAHRGNDRASLVRERNDLAREHRQLVDLYAVGRVSMEAVEEAEWSLLDARHRLGEIDAVRWHHERALLAERRVERTGLRVDAGVIPAHDLGRARLTLERERLLAGEGDGYAAARLEFLASETTRHRAMVDAGLVTVKSAEEDQARVEDEFPPEAELRASDR